MVLEGEVRKQVAGRLKRGRIDVYINLEFASDADKVPVLNRTLAENYLQVLEGMERSFELSGGVTVQLLAAQKDVITSRKRGSRRWRTCGTAWRLLLIRLDDDRGHAKRGREGHPSGHGGTL
ncbi:MAG: YicC/YloC family endoribonuclease [Syntrophotaleaceae bacterium]